MENTQPTPVAEQINRAGRELCRELAPLCFSAPVTHVYNPLEYARRPHEAYVQRYGSTGRRVLLLGMNPGPFGMVQTGVPFGEVQLVREWLGIEEPVDRPPREHPRRPVQGFACRRSEVSGRRLWGAAAGHFVTPEDFFRVFFVANYCPLVFMEESGRNRTPDKLPAGEQASVFAACDRYLRQLVRAFAPAWVIGVGAFAEKRARFALQDMIAAAKLQVAGILHPSPANPRANAGWQAAAHRQLRDLGVCGKG